MRVKQLPVCMYLALAPFRKHCRWLKMRFLIQQLFFLGIKIKNLPVVIEFSDDCKGIGTGDGMGS